jgi:hypothetical protein
LGGTETTGTTTKTDGATRWIGQPTTRFFAGSAFAPSASGSFMFDHRLMWLYPFLQLIIKMEDESCTFFIRSLLFSIV